jgi:hypothetical protein
MDWESRFSTWGTAPSRTENLKCDNAERAVKSAIEESQTFTQKTMKVFAQGSYRNRTNVRADSDVDICVLCRDSFFFDLPNGGTISDFGISTPAQYPFSEYKNDVQAALTSHFGSASIRRGNKAFDIHANTYRVDADAVPTFEYRQYFADRTYREGVAFMSDSGTITINFPEQNYANGVAKNDATSKQYKTMVRILKSLLNQMGSEGIAEASQIPSFLIECAIWDVPDSEFGKPTLYESVRAILLAIWGPTRQDSTCSGWTEVNGFKYLFHSSQPWTRDQLNRFSVASWNYVGYK